MAISDRVIVMKASSTLWAVFALASITLSPVSCSNFYSLSLATSMSSWVTSRFSRSLLFPTINLTTSSPEYLSTSSIHSFTLLKLSWLESGSHFISYVKSNDDGIGSSIIGICDSPVAFLSSRIPLNFTLSYNLQLHILLLDRKGPEPLQITLTYEVYSDGRNVILIEGIILIFKLLTENLTSRLDLPTLESPISTILNRKSLSSEFILTNPFS